MELKELFDEYDIKYWESGKNVSNGWVNIQCPFCDDSSNHLGIRLKDLRVHCWKCGGKSIIKLCQRLFDDVTPSEARQRALSIESYGYTAQTGQDKNRKIDTEFFEKGGVRVPKEATVHMPRLHREYLQMRNFKPFQIARKYKLKAIYNTGRYAFRIFIPIYVGGKLKSFTTRDVTGYGDPPYLHAMPEDSLIKAKHLIYNVDNISAKREAVLVEGVADVWRLGDNAIASLGTKLSSEQFVEINKLDLNKLFILFDNDRAGNRNKKKVAAELAPLVKAVEIVTVPEMLSDPGELPTADAEVLMRHLGLRE
jgi:DNA primase